VCRIRIAFQRLSAAEPKMGECAQRTIHDNGALINEFLELARSFASPVLEQVGLPPANTRGR
jgi:hypothetical protein